MSAQSKNYEEFLVVWTEEADGDEDEQESSFSTDKEESQYNLGLSGTQVR